MRPGVHTQSCMIGSGGDHLGLWPVTRSGRGLGPQRRRAANLGTPPKPCLTGHWRLLVRGGRCGQSRFPLLPARLTGHMIQPAAAQLLPRERYMPVHEIENELFRLQATGIKVEGEPMAAGDFVTITAKGKSSRVRLAGLLNLLRQLPDSAGPIAVVRALRRSARLNEGWATR